MLSTQTMHAETTRSSRPPGTKHRDGRAPTGQALQCCVSCNEIMARSDLDAFGCCLDCVWTAQTRHQSRQWRLRWPPLLSSVFLLTGLATLTWPLRLGQGWHLGGAAVMVMLLLGVAGVWGVYQGIQGRQHALRARDQGDRDPSLMCASTAALVAGYLTTGVAVIGFSLG